MDQAEVIYTNWPQVERMETWSRHEVETQNYVLSVRNGDHGVGGPYAMCSGSPALCLLMTSWAPAELAEAGLAVQQNIRLVRIKRLSSERNIGCSCCSQCPRLLELWGEPERRVG